MQRNHQTGSRRWQGDDERGNRYRNREEDQGRYSSAEDEREYGSYTENDEGDSSVRAGSYDQGRGRFAGRDPRETGGSTGRYAGYGSFGQGDYGGSRQRGTSGAQDRFGQRGYGQGGDFGQGSNYGQGRRGFSDYDDQFRRSSPGGFGQAQGSSAWRGYGVEGDYSTWNEPYGEGQQYTSRGDYGGTEFSGGTEFGGQGAQYRGQGSQYRGQGSQYGQGTQYGYGYGGAGQHRGKGPKGYQRSDERLKEMICERLREDPQIDASEVTVTVQGNRVTFDGSVDSRHTKNLIEDVAEQFGVDDVQNNLRVQRDQSQAGRSASGAASSGSRGASSGAGADEEQSKQKRSN
jgi:osmotically-inducible protein OsmY